MLLFAVTESMWNRCRCIMRFVIVYWHGPCYHTNYLFEMNLNKFCAKEMTHPSRLRRHNINSSFCNNFCVLTTGWKRGTVSQAFFFLCPLFRAFIASATAWKIESDKQYMAIPVSQQTCVISTWNCFQGGGVLICVFMIIDIQVPWWYWLFLSSCPPHWMQFDTSAIQGAWINFVYCTYASLYPNLSFKDTESFMIGMAQVSLTKWEFCDHIWYSRLEWK